MASVSLVMLRARLMPGNEPIIVGSGRPIIYVETDPRMRVENAGNSHSKNVCAVFLDLSNNRIGCKSYVNQAILPRMPLYTVPNSCSIWVLQSIVGIDEPAQPAG